MRGSKYFVLFVTFTALFVAVIACSCTPKTTDPAPLETSTASLTIEDSVYTLTCSSAVLTTDSTPSKLYIDLFINTCQLNKGKQVVIEITNPHVGTFDARDSLVKVVERVEGLHYYTDSRNGKGTITIEKMTPTMVSGKFDVVGYTLGRTDAHDVEGTFSIVLAPSRLY